MGSTARTPDFAEQALSDCSHYRCRRIPRWAAHACCIAGGSLESWAWQIVLLPGSRSGRWIGRGHGAALANAAWMPGSYCSCLRYRRSRGAAGARRRTMAGLGPAGLRGTVIGRGIRLGWGFAGVPGSNDSSYGPAVGSERRHPSRQGATGTAAGGTAAAAEGIASVIASGSYLVGRAAGS